MTISKLAAARSRIAAVLLVSSIVVGGVITTSSTPVSASTVVTDTYNYTGSTQTFTVPAGVTSLNVTLKGGQGGRGGRDWSVQNFGGYQGVVTGTIAVTPGQVITVAVGGGGGDGAGGGSAAGGTAGQNPLAGYDGAVGGISGPAGSSGGGGGSGAATVMQIAGTDVVAGGAGGNGGNGQYEPIIGRVAEDHHVPRPDTTSTTGRPGYNTTIACGGTCDGGASGAGGGGVQGGDRGDVQYGGATATEWFGFGGAPGSNSTGGFVGLVATYNVYSTNNQHGSITISYDNGAPGAPLNLNGTAHTGAVALAWNAPASSGATPITDYRVEYATNPAGSYTVFADGVSTALEAEVAPLVNGTTYYFRVTAINGQGDGPSATTALGIVPSDVPAAPTVTGLVPFGGGIHVDFTAGLSHAPITGYQFRLDGGDWTAGSVTGNRLSISGLVNGRTYSVEIRELNSIGAGPSSSPAQSAMPVDTPQAPTAVIVTAGDTSADVTWAAPLVVNGSDVTDYVVQTATSVGGTYSTFADGVSTATSATITGLTNGTTYYVRIGAVNAVGTGAWSVPTVATPYTSPDAPSIGVVPADGALAVTITPGFDGGLDVTSYEYRVGLDGEWRSTGSLGSTFLISGLTNGTPYDVVVRATNAAGTSPESDPATGTPRTVPAAPAISTVALDTGAVDVAFAVGSDGGSPLTNVQYSIDGGAHWISRYPASPASPLTISGLTGGVTYPVALRVVNAAGVSAISNVSSVTATGTPDAPVIIVTEHDRSLGVAFTTPTNGGSSITGYDYSVDGGLHWTNSASTTSPLVIAGLANGVSYDVRLRATNAAGSGASSPTVTGTPRTTPSAPAIVGDTAVGVDGWIDVDFTAPASNGGSPILNYEYSTDGGATWFLRTDGATTDSPLRITSLSTDGETPLEGATEYLVEVRAVNAAGPGLASAVATGSTTTVPAAPVITQIDRRDGAARIHFAAPANGGDAITSYQYRVGGPLGTWTDTGTLATEFDLLPLANGTVYLVEVRAVNGVGDGAASEPELFSIYAAPGAPAINGIVPGDGTLTVSFDAPGDDGGSPVTDYEYSTDGGLTWQTAGTTESPIVITDESGLGAPALQNATVYAVQVRAVNVAGPGVASESSLVAPRGVPAAPTGFVVDSGDGELTLSFVLGSDGGSPITAIEYRIDGGEWTAAGSLSSPLTIGNLENGTEYTVAVRATNAIGAGAATAPLAGTPATVPGAPTDVTAISGAGSIHVTWQPPVDAGGDAVDGYTASVYAQAAGGIAVASCSTSTLTCDVTGLTNGVAVYVDVVATNGAGTGPASSPRLVRTPLAAPQVSIGSVSPAATEVSVDVSITDGGGAPITGYEYQLDDGEWVDAGSATSPFTISGLTTGQTYSLRIRAISAGGTGPASEAMDVVPHSPPSAPLSFAASSGPSSGVLSWAVPASDGGQPITDYVVQYATDAGGPFTTFADGTSTVRSATVTGLTNSTAYVFRVAAVNTAGTGPWSSLSGATPRSAPSAPTIGTIVPGGSYLTVPFTAPADNGGAAVTGYQYRLDGGAWTTASQTSTPITIAGLTNGQTYVVELRAVNSVGGGTPSAPVSAAPFGLPAGVIGLRATPGANSVTLDWDVVDDNGSPITSYNLIRWSTMIAGGISASYTTTSTTYTVTGLGAGTYYFTIEATNAAGTGPRSTPRTTAIIGGTVPSAPTVDSVTATGTNATIAWTAGAQGSSAITSYMVQYSTDGSTWATLSSGSAATSAALVLPSATTPYSLRVAAVSAVGVGAFATVQPPLATTDPVSSVTDAGADVTGSVNANGGTASVGVEYATSLGALGTLAATVVPTTPLTASGSTATPVSAELTGLAVGTQYVVRVIATSGGATTYGAPRTFTTDAVITTTDLSYEYTGSPVSLTTTTSPAILPLHRTYVGVGDTTYPSTSTPPVAAGTYQVTTTPADVAIGGEEVASFAITPKLLTVSITAEDRDYDGTTAVDVNFAIDGLVFGDDVEVDPLAVDAQFADADAGDDKVVTIGYFMGVDLLTGADVGNYSFTVAPGPVTASIAQASQTLSFASSAPVLSVVGETYTPVVESDGDLTPVVAVTSGADDVCTIEDGTVTFTGAGTCVLEASQAGDGNYLAAESVEQELQVVDVPGAVEELAVAAGDGSLTITWAAPAADGGSPVTGFTVSAGPGRTCTVETDTPSIGTPPTTYECVFTGLTNGVSYDITVTAVSDAGVGIPTERSGVPFGLPGTPAVTVGVATGGLGVSWTAADPNGRPVTAYKIFVDGALVATVAGSARSHELTGLDAGLTVTVGVAAVNLAGQGVPGTASGTTTPPEIDLSLDVEVGAPVSNAPVHVEGHGLKPFSSVTVEMHSTPVVLGTFTTDAAGSFSAVVHLPSTIPAGDHEIVVVGEAPDGAPVSDQASIFVDWSGSVGWTDGGTGEVDPIAPTVNRYTSIEPVRVLDTRDGAGVKVAAGQTYRLSFADAVLPADTTAVVMNVAVADPEADGFVTVYGCASDRPAASALNYQAGETVANLVTAAQRDGAELCLYSLSTTHLVVDLSGYYRTAAGDPVMAQSPVRLADTRTTGRLAAGGTLVIDVAGAGRAPAGSTAASLYVAVTAPAADGFLTVYPCGTDVPLASNLNFVAGQTIGNSTLTKLGADGTVCVYSLVDTDVVVDLSGTAGPDAAADFRPLIAGRVLDTRVTGDRPIAGSTLVLDFSSVAAGAAVALNVAVVDPDADGFVTVFPCGIDRPLVAGVNYDAGRTHGNQVTVKLGADRTVCVYTLSATDLVIDVEGLHVGLPT